MQPELPDLFDDDDVEEICYLYDNTSRETFLREFPVDDPEVEIEDSEETIACIAVYLAWIDSLPCLDDYLYDY